MAVERVLADFDVFTHLYKKIVAKYKSKRDSWPTSIWPPYNVADYVGDAPKLPINSARRYGPGKVKSHVIKELRALYAMFNSTPRVGNAAFFVHEQLMFAEFARYVTCMIRTDNYDAREEADEFHLREAFSEAENASRQYMAAYCQQYSMLKRDRSRGMLSNKKGGVNLHLPLYRAWCSMRPESPSDREAIRMKMKQRRRKLHSYGKSLTKRHVWPLGTVRVGDPYFKIVDHMELRDRAKKTPGHQIIHDFMKGSSKWSACLGTLRADFQGMCCPHQFNVSLARRKSELFTPRTPIKPHTPHKKLVMTKRPVFVRGDKELVELFDACQFNRTD